MDYRQYLRSAERHLQTCRQLLVKYNSVSDANSKSYLLDEVYYLSGYILESSLIYAFFNHIRYTSDIYLSEHYYINCFMTHRIQTKYLYMTQRSCVIRDLIFVSRSHTSKVLQDLFNNWDVKYRYEHYPRLDKTLLDDYINELENGLKKIKKLYPS